MRLSEPPSPAEPAPSAPAPRAACGPGDEQLHVAERYLAEYGERYGELAALQAIISLSADESTAHLDIDPATFPRSAAALRVVRNLQHSENPPQGFWVRFLLGQLRP